MCITKALTKLNSCRNNFFLYCITFLIKLIENGWSKLYWFLAFTYRHSSSLAAYWPAVVSRPWLLQDTARRFKLRRHFLGKTLHMLNRYVVIGYCKFTTVFTYGCPFSRNDRLCLLEDPYPDLNFYTLFFELHEQQIFHKNLMYSIYEYIRVRESQAFEMRKNFNEVISFFFYRHIM